MLGTPGPRPRPRHGRNKRQIAGASLAAVLAVGLGLHGWGICRWQKMFAPPVAIVGACYLLHCTGGSADSLFGLPMDLLSQNQQVFLVTY